jgi:hypothetical protein
MNLIDINLVIRWSQPEFWVITNYNLWLQKRDPDFDELYNLIQDTGFAFYQILCRKMDLEDDATKKSKLQFLSACTVNSKSKFTIPQSVYTVKSKFCSAFIKSKGAEPHSGLNNVLKL